MFCERGSAGGSALRPFLAGGLRGTSLVMVNVLVMSTQVLVLSGRCSDECERSSTKDIVVLLLRLLSLIGAHP